jgi:acylphosphatase
MTSESLQLHAVVHGRVQGVNYRYYTQQTAADLGLTGWVRNLPEGTVEVTAEGSRIRLERLLRWLRQGPPSARVDGIEVNWLPATGEYPDFRVR